MKIIPFLAVLAAWGVALFQLGSLVRGPDGWASFYPLCFIPLLTERCDPKRSLSWWSLAWFALFLSGVTTTAPALSWVGAFGLLTASLRIYGVHLGWRAGFLLLVSPPFLLKLDILFGYHLRDAATFLALIFLKFLDPSVRRIGNGIVFAGGTYYVERLCEGLRTFAALVTMLMVLSNRYSALGNALRKSAAWCALTVGSVCLWFLSNAVRVFALVVLTVPHASFLHEVIGIITFACMVLFPIVTAAESYFIQEPVYFALASLRWRKVIPLTSIPLLSVILVWIQPRVVALGGSDFVAWSTRIGAYSRIPSVIDGKEIDIPDIVAYQSGERYLIVKKGLSPLRFSHHPMQCWSALGYQIAGEESVATSHGHLRAVGLRAGRGDYSLKWYYLIMNTSDFQVSDSEVAWRVASLFRGAQVVQVNELRQRDDKAEDPDVPFLVSREVQRFGSGKTADPRR